MRTRVLIVPLLAIMMLLTPAVVFADPTILDMDWYGAGSVTVYFTADDDALMSFATGGDLIDGYLYAEIGDVDHYSYGVYDFSTHVDAYVDNGFIQYVVDRTDSTGMYGDADQSTYSGILSDDWASLTFRTGTNYARLRSSNYGFQSDNHFLAGGLYSAYHTVINGNNWARFDAIGYGTLVIDHMADDTWVTGIEFGWGDGCYTNADVTQTGSGTFELSAHFENSFTMGGMTVSGPMDYYQSISFSDGFSWSDYSFEGS